VAARFELGQVVITASANEVLDAIDVLLAIKRHHQGDWGDLDPHDKRENEFSMKNGLRLLSVYKDREGTTFWIITEADRSVTTILLPSDY